MDLYYTAPLVYQTNVNNIKTGEISIMLSALKLFLPSIRVIFTCLGRYDNSVVLVFFFLACVYSYFCLLVGSIGGF